MKIKLCDDKRLKLGMKKNERQEEKNPQFNKRKNNVQMKWTKANGKNIPKWRLWMDAIFLGRFQIKSTPPRNVFIRWKIHNHSIMYIRRFQSKRLSGSMRNAAFACYPLSKWSKHSQSASAYSTKCKKCIGTHCRVNMILAF